MLYKHGKFAKKCAERLQCTMDVWSPSVGDEFAMEIDEINIHDRLTVASNMDGRVIPRKTCFCSVVPLAAFRRILA